MLCFRPGHVIYIDRVKREDNFLCYYCEKRLESAIQRRRLVYHKGEKLRVRTTPLAEQVLNGTHPPIVTDGHITATADKH